MLKYIVDFWLIPIENVFIVLIPGTVAVVEIRLHLVYKGRYGTTDIQYIYP